MPKSFKEGQKLKEFSNNKVSIWHWNVNGINAVLTKGSFQKFIDSTNPDILCLNETKID